MCVDSSFSESIYARTGDTSFSAALLPPRPPLSPSYRLILFCDIHIRIAREYIKVCYLVASRAFASFAARAAGMFITRMLPQRHEGFTPPMTVEKVHLQSRHFHQYFFLLVRLAPFFLAENGLGNRPSEEWRDCITELVKSLLLGSFKLIVIRE